MTSFSRSTLWTLIACAPLAAQQEEQTSPTAPRAPLDRGAPVVATRPESAVPALGTARRNALLGARTPIHTAADDPDGGAYGTWAAGADYKASFHDGFTFVPYLGGAYPHNQPFAWRTVAATVGGEPVAVLDRPQPASTEYRYEYRFGGLTEAYDVLVEGVEQTFVIDARPRVIGDLVVRGRVDTALTAEPVLDEHTGIVFSDADGHAILRYGAAFAIDAHGARTDVLTTFDGREIHLRVPGDWLARAAFPVTIDPLLTRECVAFWSTTSAADGDVLEVDVGRDDIANDLMVAYTRQASSTDIDMWIWLFTDDAGTLASRNQVFSDLSDSWGNLSPAVAFAGGSGDSWIVAFIRSDVGGPGVNGARYHVHASGDTTSNTSFSSISRPSGSSHGEVIDVGGVMGLGSSSTVFVVYERDAPRSFSDIFGKPIDLSGNTQGTEVRIDSTAAGTSYTRRRPSINQVAQSGSDGWVVGFQEYWDARSGGGDDWDINLRRIDSSGTPTGSASFPTNSTPDDTHKLTPRVTGANGHYAVGMTVWAQSPPLTKTSTAIGTDIFNQVFEWPVNGSATQGELCELTRGLVSDRRWRITDGTHDTNTDSHFAFAFESTTSGTQYAATAGFDAGLIERASAYSPAGTADAFGGSVTFDDDANHFVFAYASDEGSGSCGSSTSASHTVYTQIMEHLPEPPETRYGTGCGPGTITWSGRNLAGIRSYSIGLDGATPNAGAVLILSGGPAQVPLGFIGMAGCAQNVDLNVVFANIPASTNSSGDARFDMFLPTCPSVVCGNFHWQWFYVAPRLNGLGVGATRGLRTDFVCP